MSKRKQNTLDNYLSKLKQNRGQITSEVVAVGESPQEAGSSMNQQTAETSAGSSNVHSVANATLNILHGYNKTIDIAPFVNTANNFFTPKEKYSVLMYAMVPNTAQNFTYPFSIHRKNDKDIKCFLSKRHFDTFSWLTYSQGLGGLFCKFCVIFSKLGGVHQSTKLGRLVTTPLNKYSKLFGKDGDLVTHDKSVYHNKAVTEGINFIKVYENPETDIRNALDQERQRQVLDNKLRLAPIIKSVIFLGRQNIPFRGHRDRGSLAVTEGTSEDENEASLVNNEGNFRELIKFRIESGDFVLKKHLENTSSRATYISSYTQNEIIECCGEEILETILQRVNNCQFYSVIFDETTDISHQSQMSIVLRYCYENCLYEDFVGFIDCHAIFDEDTLEPTVSGEILAQIVLNFIKKINLNPDMCIGIGTDTCNLMLGEQKGAVAELKKTLPNALKSPCSSHSLNLSISKSSSVQGIRNAVGVIKEVCAFFKASAKRNFLLRGKLDGHSQIKSLCETRWVERHESVLQFQSNIKIIVDLLDIISNWRDREASSKAESLKNAVSSTVFIVSLCALSDILALTVNLSKILQTKSIDKQYATMLTQNIITVLKERRENSETYFRTVFTSVLEIHEKLNLEITRPRVTQRQTHRPNISAENNESYFRLNIYIILLDNILQDFQFRFNDESLNTYEFNILFPSIFNSKTEVEITQSIKVVAEYISKFDHTQNKDMILLKLKSEFNIWKNIEKSDTDGIGIYSACDENIFPLIKKCLQVLVTLPVSVASAERSFSSLRRLKTWLRSTMVQDRLVGLSLLFMHRDINVNVDNVINRFAHKKNRRLEFTI